MLKNVSVQINFGECYVCNRYKTAQQHVDMNNLLFSKIFIFNFLLGFRNNYHSFVMMKNKNKWYHILAVGDIL